MIPPGLRRLWPITPNPFQVVKTVGVLPTRNCLLLSRKWPTFCAQGVTFHTDHKPLIFLKGNSKLNGKHTRWLLEQENFEYEIVYIAGKDNKAADYLSGI